MLKLTLKIFVPEVNDSEELYFAANINEWNCKDNKFKIKKITNSLFYIDVYANYGYHLEYKITRGSWESVEELDLNREYHFINNNQIVKIDVSKWKDCETTKYWEGLNMAFWDKEGITKVTNDLVVEGKSEKSRIINFLRENEKNFKTIAWSDMVNKYSEVIYNSKEILELMTKEEYFAKKIKMDDGVEKSIADDIRNIQKEMKHFMEKATNPEYHIAIVGAIKAGKSTLINALIDSDLASVDVTPETATLTKFRYSDGKNFFKVSFYTKTEWLSIWKSAIESKADVFLKEYKELNAESVIEKYLNQKQQVFEFSDLKEMKKEIARWTSSKSQEHYFVKEIEIGLSNLMLPHQVCLIDTPGLNDVVEYRSNITKEYISKANAVIVCVNAKTLRSEEILTISKVFDKAAYKKDKILVVGTQIDTMNSEEDRKKQSEKWMQYLESAAYFESSKMAKSNILWISSEAYNASKSDFDIQKLGELKIFEKEEFKKINREFVNNDDKFSEETKNKLIDRMIDFSGIRNIEKIVKDNWVEGYKESLLIDFQEDYKNLNKEVKSFSDRYKIMLEENLKKTKMDKEELAIKQKKEEEELKMKKLIIENLEKEKENAKRVFNSDFKNFEDSFKKLEQEIVKIKVE